MKRIQQDFVRGDRVRCIEDWCTPVNYGDEGTVVDGYDGEFVAVEWDTESTLKHSCNGRCAKGHGWLLPHNCLELVSAAPNDAEYTVLQLDELFGLRDDIEFGKIAEG